MSAYLIADVEITNETEYQEYRERVPAVIEAHGGRYLVRGGASEVLEGSWSLHRSVILEFPNMKALKAFWDSADYAPLKAMRNRTATSQVVAMDGL